MHSHIYGSQNMFNIKTQILACIGVFAVSLFHQNCALSNENHHTEPLHIKISSQNNHKQSSKFNIIKGAIAVKIRPAIKPKNPKAVLLQKEVNTKKTITPQIIETLPCHENLVTNNNRYENLANSLRLYIKDKKRDPAIIDDILSASNTTNIDFKLLLVKAMIESDLGRVTTSGTSSARGIFQYIDPTWISLMKRYSGQIGYDGSQSNEEILNLRHNNRISALIKAYQIKDETKFIARIKRNKRVNATDHYITHMLGLPLASKFYKLLNNNSDTILANSNDAYFKEAMRLNPYFFYNSRREPLTAAQAYKQFSKKISQKYKRLAEISAQYGGSIMDNSRCQQQEIKTARNKSAIKTTIRQIRVIQK